MKLLLLVCMCKVLLGAPAKDLISKLPGLKEQPLFKQYSGYLSASSTKRFFYWFVESQKNPANDPLVLWLNGGPGCSSLDGLLSENGPFRLNNDGKTLRSDPYSWNKIANVLYLESPAGVGYSFDENGAIATNDDEVSLNNYNALIDFFKKFPEFSKNAFFIIAESYGGVYAPTLSVRIIDGSFDINFKGFAIGNGLTNATKNSLSVIFFAYYHGLFGESLKQRLVQHCCNGIWSRHHCNFSLTLFPERACFDALLQANNVIYKSGLNYYALYLDCYGGTGSSTIRYQMDMRSLLQGLKEKDRLKITNTKLASSRDGSLGLVPPCINATASTAWLNRADVKEALHVSSHIETWSICSDAVHTQYGRTYADLSKQFNRVFEHPNLRVLVYNGDTDMAVNFLGDQWFVEDLKRPVKRTCEPWYVNGQVAGFAKIYDHITFTTIRGAGHMVPQWAPLYAFTMFEKFLNDQPF